jgi:hypothetical protein
MFGISRLFDVIFLFDILFNFFTAYYHEASQTWWAQVTNHTTLATS